MLPGFQAETQQQQQQQERPGKQTSSSCSSRTSRTIPASPLLLGFTRSGRTKQLEGLCSNAEGEEVEAGAPHSSLSELLVEAVEMAAVA